MLAMYLSALECDAERERFRVLYEQMHERMERAALHYLGDRHEAEDAVQNAFMQIIRHYDKISDIPCEKLPAWCISIVKNEALMLLRRRRKVVALEEWGGFADNAGEAASYHALVELFASLPETYRAALEMKLLYGYSDGEIAQHLGLTVTAVSTRVSRGRALLRTLAEKEGILG